MRSRSTLVLFLSLLATAAFSQNYLMNGSLTNVNDCSGFFLDSGGGSAPYGPNESFTTTICPDGSTGTHIQLVFNGTDIADGDELCFYDGDNTGAPSLSCASAFTGASANSFIIQATAANPTGCLTITFTSDGSVEGAGWSADINCIPACQIIEAVIDSTYPGISPVDTGWIDICPGDRVFLFGTGNYPQNGVVYNHSDLTSNFAWDFGDGATSQGPATSHVYDEPGGYIISMTITDQLGCRNTNFIKQRVRVAPKPNFALSTYTNPICVNDTVSLNAMVDSVDMMHTVSVLPGNSGFQTAGVLSDSLPLPDGNGSSYSTSINFSEFNPGQVLTDINDLLGIFVNMEHSWMRDLQIRLTCPNGQTAILHNHPGQTGSEVFLGEPYEADEGFPVPIPGIGWEYGWSPNPDYNFTWIDYANTFSPPTLPSGTYQSYQPLTNFLGCPLNGEWTIEVTDLWPIDNGYIFSWSIAFDPDLYPFVETFSPDLIAWNWSDHPSILYNNPDSIVGSPTNAGEVAYTFTVNDEFGCAWDTTVNIQVLPATHPDCHSCADLLTPMNDTTICFEESVQLDVSGAPGANPAVTFESYDDYPIGAGNHPPANPYASVINVNSIQPAFLTNPAAQIASICLDLDTDFDADIRLFLRAPDGTQLELSTNNGGSGDNYTQTCFTPTATLPITTGVPPFTGSFLPEGNWNVLNGVPINGDWALLVSDAFGINALGNLNWWSITFNTINQVTYAWNPIAELSCSDCPNPIAIPTSDVDFTVTATDLYGCQDVETVHVGLLVNFPAPNVTCTELPGGQIRFNWNDLPQGGISYLVNVNGTGWVPNNFGAAGHVVSGLSNGETVTIEVQVNAPGTACEVGTGTATCTYSLCPLVTSFITPGPYSTSCSGLCDAEVEIDVQNAALPLSYEINNLTTGTSSTQNSGLITGLCGGNYEVYITDAAGCVDTVSFSVSEPPGFNLTAQQLSPPTCFNTPDGCATALANGGAAPYTYTWNIQNLPVGDTVCILPAGTLTVTAQDANGCEATTSLDITGPPAITLSLAADSVKCLGGADGQASVMANGGAGSFSYQWSAGNTPDQPSTGGLSAGTYTVTVSDQNGCTEEGSIEVGQPATAVSVVAAQTFTGCYGENGSEAAATGMGGTGAISFSWSPSGQQGNLATSLPAGPQSVIATDANGCRDTATVDITEWDSINISIIANPPTCNGMTNGQMAVNLVTGGNGDYVSYTWSNNQQGPIISNLSGSNTYTVTVTDSQGCTGTMSRTLDEPPAMSLNLTGTDALCYGQPSGTASVTAVQNAQGTVMYQWDAATGGQTTATATDLPAGTYSVIVTDTAGCTANGTVTIGEPSGMNTNFSVTDNECFGYANGAVDLDVSGGAGAYQYAWSNGASTAKQVDLPAGWYFVTVTDGNGCEKEDSVFVGQPEPLGAQVNVQDVRCFGEENGMIEILTSGGTPPFLYSSDGVDYFGSNTMIALPAGDYQLFIKDGNGCIFQEQVSVAEPPLMTLSITADGTDTSMLLVPFGNSVELSAVPQNAQGSVMYTWDASYCGTLSCDTLSDCNGTLMCQTVTSTPDDSNNYWVLAIDEKGCEAEAHFQIHVQKERKVMVPTGFTPNGDGVNDLLPVHGQSGTMVKLFRVFDRWGELLFEGIDVPVNDISKGWDGNFNGHPMPPGVYVWYIEVEYTDGMTDNFRGETTLIR